MKINKHVTNWDEYPELPHNTEILIKSELIKERMFLQDNNLGNIIESTRLQPYNNGKQLFAVMGATAYEVQNLIIEENGEKFAWRPALLNGVAFRSFLDEGKNGTLHWFFSDKNSEWKLMWFSACGWIYTSELEQSSNEILTHIIEEINVGKTPITGNDSESQYS